MIQSSFRPLTDAEARGLSQALARLGRARSSAFMTLDAEAVERLGAAAAWRTPPGEGYEEAALPDPAVEAGLRSALAPLSTAARDVRLVRHRPGAHGAPATMGTGFTIDLTSGRSRHGGLLLFLDEDGGGDGWRPETGALTLYDGARPPLLTMVTPDAPQFRLTIFGTL